MQIVVLGGFLVALSLADVPGASAPPWLLAAAAAAYLALPAAVTHLNVRLCLARMGGAGTLPPPVLRRHHVLAVATQAWLVAGLAGLMLLGLSRWVMDDLGLGRVPLAGTLAVLAPFVAGLLLTWVLDYPFHRVARARIVSHLGSSPAGGAWTRAEHLAYNVRHHLLFIAAPVGLIVLIRDLLHLYAWWLVPEGLREYVLPAGMVLAAGGVFLLAPLMVVRIWRTQPLAAGPLREELLAFSRRLGLRFRDLLVWLSGGVVANAGVMGLVAPVRYVLLSDALLEHMDRQQVKAIFAHEAGHIVCHHILYSLIFVLSLLTLVGSACLWLAWWLEWPSWAGDVLALVALAAAFAGGFGWLSRRFERQSDVIAAWLVSRPLEDLTPRTPITPEGAAVFAEALERVAELNGLSRRQRNWRHGSIARRVAHVLWLAETGQGREPIDRLVGRVKVALWVAAAAAAGAIALQLLLT